MTKFLKPLLLILLLGMVAIYCNCTGVMAILNIKAKPSMSTEIPELPFYLKYINWNEVKCSHCGELPDTIYLKVKMSMAKANLTRNISEMAFKVNSGHRCSVYNNILNQNSKAARISWHVGYYDTNGVFIKTVAFDRGLIGHNLSDFEKKRQRQIFWRTAAEAGFYRRGVYTWGIHQDDSWILPRVDWGDMSLIRKEEDL